MPERELTLEEMLSILELVPEISIDEVLDIHERELSELPPKERDIRLCIETQLRKLIEDIHKKELPNTPFRKCDVLILYDVSVATLTHEEGKIYECVYEEKLEPDYSIIALHPKLPIQPFFYAVAEHLLYEKLNYIPDYKVIRMIGKNLLKKYKKQFKSIINECRRLYA